MGRESPGRRPHTTLVALRRSRDFRTGFSARHTTWRVCDLAGDQVKTGRIAHIESYGV
jgi:hypothetical protein